MNKQNKIRNYSEADLILLYDLKRMVGAENNPLLQEWLNATTTLNDAEQFMFRTILDDARQNIYGWHEEELKMKFIAVILQGKSYCLSKSYDCTEEDDLLTIIAILRKFKTILITQLLKS